MIKRIAMFCLPLLLSTAVLAKLPPPSDEAKLKALETKQKTAWSDKVAAFQLCKSQDATAEKYRKGKKDLPVAIATPKCEDPGPFVFVPPEAAPATAPAAAPAAATPAVPAAAAPATPVAAAAPAKK